MPRCDAIALYCQDVRQEKSDQLSLVGVFPDAIQISGSGRVIPKLAIYFTIFASIDFVFSDLYLKLLSPSNDTITSTHVDIERLATTAKLSAQDNDPIYRATLFHIMTPFHVGDGGLFRAVATMNGEEIICGSLRIKVDSD